MSTFAVREALLVTGLCSAETLSTAVLFQLFKQTHLDNVKHTVITELCKRRGVSTKKLLEIYGGPHNYGSHQQIMMTELRNRFSACTSKQLIKLFPRQHDSIQSAILDALKLPLNECSNKELLKLERAAESYRLEKKIAKAFQPRLRNYSIEQLLELYPRVGMEIQFVIVRRLASLRSCSMAQLLGLLRYGGVRSTIIKQASKRRECTKKVLVELFCKEDSIAQGCILALLDKRGELSTDELLQYFHQVNDDRGQNEVLELLRKRSDFNPAQLLRLYHEVEKPDSQRVILDALIDHPDELKKLARIK